MFKRKLAEPHDNRTTSKSERKEGTKQQVRVVTNGQSMQHKKCTGKFCEKIYKKDIGAK